MLSTLPVRHRLGRALHIGYILYTRFLWCTHTGVLWLIHTGVLWLMHTGVLWLIHTGVLWLIHTGVLWLVHTGVLWLVHTGVLWLIHTVCWRAVTITYGVLAETPSAYNNILIDGNQHVIVLWQHYLNVLTRLRGNKLSTQAAGETTFHFQ